MTFDTLSVTREGAVLFVEIAAPPMNLLGPELVRDLVSLISEAEPDEAAKVLHLQTTYIVATVAALSTCLAGSPQFVLHDTIA